MLSWLVALIVTFLIVLFLTDDGSISLSLSFLVALLVGVNSCTQIEPGDERFAVRDTTDIQSAVVGSKIQGDFFLGSGQIEGKRYYAYWTSEGTVREGAVQRQIVKEGSWDVEIIETDTTDPKIIFTEYEKQTPSLWHVYLRSNYQRATIFVPEGTIRYNFNIKAK